MLASWLGWRSAPRRADVLGADVVKVLRVFRRVPGPPAVLDLLRRLNRLKFSNSWRSDLRRFGPRASSSGRVVFCSCRLLSVRVGLCPLPWIVGKSAGVRARMFGKCRAVRCCPGRLRLQVLGLSSRSVAVLRSIFGQFPIDPRAIFERGQC